MYKSRSILEAFDFNSIDTDKQLISTLANNDIIEQGIKIKYPIIYNAIKNKTNYIITLLDENIDDTAIVYLKGDKTIINPNTQGYKNIISYYLLNTEFTYDYGYGRNDNNIPLNVAAAVSDIIKKILNIHSLQYPVETLTKMVNADNSIIFYDIKPINYEKNHILCFIIKWKETLNIQNLDQDSVKQKTQLEPNEFVKINYPFLKYKDPVDSLLVKNAKWIYKNDTLQLEQFDNVVESVYNHILYHTSNSLHITNFLGGIGTILNNVFLDRIRYLSTSSNRDIEINYKNNQIVIDGLNDLVINSISQTLADRLLEIKLFNFKIVSGKYAFDKPNNQLIMVFRKVMGTINNIVDVGYLLCDVKIKGAPKFNKRYKKLLN